jgi:hypothetical protein
VGYIEVFGVERVCCERSMAIFFSAWMRIVKEERMTGRETKLGIADYLDSAGNIALPDGVTLMSNLPGLRAAISRRHTGGIQMTTRTPMFRTQRPTRGDRLRALYRQLPRSGNRVVTVSNSSAGSTDNATGTTVIDYA